MAKRSTQVRPRSTRPTQVTSGTTAGRPPAGNIDASADWLASRLDPRISREQWRAWAEEGGLSADCPPEKPFKSMREGGEGVCVEKPVDCPEGMFLHGNRCYNTGETPGGFGVEGYVGPGGPGAKGTPAVPGLQDLLSSMAWNRVAGLNQFGGIPGASPAFSPFGAAAGGAPSFAFEASGGPFAGKGALTASLLKGGGLMWAPTNQDQLLAQPPGAPGPVPPIGGTKVTNPGLPRANPPRPDVVPPMESAGLIPQVGGLAGLVADQARRRRARTLQPRGVSNTGLPTAPFGYM